MYKNNGWIKTNRLVIYEPDIKYKEQILSLVQNHEVSPYVLHGTMENDINFVLEDSIRHFNENNFSIGPVFLNENNEFIGRAGLYFIDFEKEKTLSLIYHLLPEYWMKGYGSEIVKSLIEFGFNKTNQEKILVLIDKTNIPSQRLIKKFNPIIEKTIILNNNEHLVYYIYKQTKT